MLWRGRRLQRAKTAHYTAMEAKERGAYRCTAHSAQRRRRLCDYPRAQLHAVDETLPSDMCTNRATTWRESSFDQTSSLALADPAVCLAVPRYPRLIVPQRYIGCQLTICILGSCRELPHETVVCRCRLALSDVIPGHATAETQKWRITFEYRL